MVELLDAQPRSRAAGAGGELPPDPAAGVTCSRRPRGEPQPDARAELEREIGQRLDAKRRVYDSHPGFARDVLAFDTRRETWRTVGQTTSAPQVTTLAVPHRGAIIIPSGEIKPGIRTPAIVRVTPVIK